MFTRLLEWIRKVFEKMFGTSTVQKALNVDLAISAEMAEALQTWTALYLNQASWLNSNIKSLNLPAARYVCAANSTSLYGCLVTRGTPTYATGDITVRLSLLPD